MQTFSQKIFKIGINPCVVPPASVLEAIFKQAGRNRGPIPVRGHLNGKPFKQTLVKYQGAWRLYVNMPMLNASKLKNGDIARVKIEYDPTSRVIPLHPDLRKQLVKNKMARAAYDKLAPSFQKELNRYLGFPKTNETMARNVATIMQFLSGKKPDGLHALLRISKKK